MPNSKDSFCSLSQEAQDCLSEVRRIIHTRTPFNEPDM